MDQVFRIEIPIQTIDMTDKGALGKIDASLERILKGLDKFASSSEKAGRQLEGVGKAASAGMKAAGGATDDAAKKTDAFEKRIDKTNKTLRGMFKERFKLIMEAVDKASPVLKQISDAAKGIMGKAWHVTV